MTDEKQAMDWLRGLKPDVGEAAETFPPAATVRVPTGELAQVVGYARFHGTRPVRVTVEFENRRGVARYDPADLKLVSCHKHPTLGTLDGAWVASVRA